MIVRLVIALVCAFFWSCVSSRAGDAENRDAVREAKAEQYRQKRSIIQEKLKSDSAFLQLVDAYERKMILGDAFIEPDSGYSFFNRWKEESDSICEKEFIDNDALNIIRELYKALWISMSGGGDSAILTAYYIEPDTVVFSGKKVHHACLAGKNPEFNNLILTEYNKIALDVFLDYNPNEYWKVPEDWREKMVFLPVKIGMVGENVCCSYGEFIKQFNLDLQNDAASIDVINGGCGRYHFKKIDGKWKFMEYEVTCWF